MPARPSSDRRSRSTLPRGSRTHLTSRGGPGRAGTAAGAVATPDVPAGATDTEAPPRDAPGPSRPAAWLPQRARELWLDRSWPGWTVSLLRRHWLASLLLAAGIALRVITQMAYHPALLYIDSLKYLYGAWFGEDPLGYRLPLKILLAFGDLGTVEVFQHLLGLAMAVAIYVLLLRRGVSRWLAALAMAPILLDGYQLQAEATIMPDVVFEALIVAALVIILWQPACSWLAALAAGLILGAAVTVREVGLILVVPAVLYMLISGGGWLQFVKKALALGLAFAVPILLYCSYYYFRSHNFELSTKGDALGRMAFAADCATLKLPADARVLCPPPAEQRLGPDWIENDPQSPLYTFTTRGAERTQLIHVFDTAVETQQPMRVVASVLRDSIRLYEVNRTPTISITPISRWQFQTHYPTYLPQINVQPSGDIVVGVQIYHSSPTRYSVLKPAYGGKAQVDKPLASFLRAYQLNGGFTPGPLLLLFTILGAIGSVLALFSRKSSPRARGLAMACMLFFVSAVGLLLVSDLYVFSWRYQLMALITLPAAGVLGATILLERFRRRKTVTEPAAIPAEAQADASLA